MSTEGSSAENTLESSIDGGGRADDGYVVAAGRCSRWGNQRGAAHAQEQQRRWRSYRGHERSSVIMSATDDDEDDLGMTAEDEGER